MSPQRWQHVKSLLESCLDQPASRSSLLAEADPEVRREVLSLLAAHDESDDFLDKSPAPGLALAEVFERDSLVGEMAGHYRLVREVGRGTGGVVYQAVRADEEFERIVAIKVLNRGLDTGLILRRFRTERQILAGLDHPNIARLLDGGTTASGLPYIVMEFVEGLPLNVYCDRYRLSVRERIELFRKVCDAVSCAHNHLIVHRDLKPGNILVTAEGTPKLLDFGIARLLSAAEEEPELLRMATPAYASPEQIRGGTVGVASDLYSLGVILYELLTGHTPYHLPNEPGQNIARIISERAPTQPSFVASYREAEADPAKIAHARSTQPARLARLLKGELDSILLRPLEKEPGRRYSSVAELSDELRRYLAGLPVDSHRQTASYRMRKFAMRHTIAIPLTCAALLILCVTTIAALYEANLLKARVAADHKLASSFLVEVHDSIAKLPGATPAREALLSHSLQYLNGLATDAGNEPVLRRSLALAYERFADLQGGTAGPGLGQISAALDTCSRARSLREALAAESPGDASVRHELATNYLLTSFLLGRAGRWQQRMEFDRKALAIMESLIQSDRRNPAYRSTLARAHTSLGYGLMLLERWEDARPHLTEALAIHTRLAEENPSNAATRRELALIHYRVGSSHAQSGQAPAALEQLASALKLQQNLSAAEPGNQVVRSEMAGTRHFMGVALGQLGRFDEALDHLDEAVKIRSAALASDPRDARTVSLLAGNHSERASVLLRSGRKQEALHDSYRAVELLNRALEQDSRSVPVRIALAGAHARSGQVLIAYAEATRPQQSRRYWSEAAAAYEKARHLYEGLRQDQHVAGPQMSRDIEAAIRAEERARREANR